MSTNTRRAYAGALGQLDAWLDGQKLDDAALAAYLTQGGNDDHSGHERRRRP